MYKFVPVLALIATVPISIDALVAAEGLSGLSAVSIHGPDAVVVFVAGMGGGGTGSGRGGGMGGGSTGGGTGGGSTGGGGGGGSTGGGMGGGSTGGGMGGGSTGGGMFGSPTQSYGGSASP